MSVDRIPDLEGALVVDLAHDLFALFEKLNIGVDVAVELKAVDLVGVCDLTGIAPAVDAKRSPRPDGLSFE